MKTLNQYIEEKLVLNSNTKIRKQEYNYHPKSREELKELIEQLLEERGNNADLNDIDTSAVTSMSGLFHLSKFNGDISRWDVSNVTTMLRMFSASSFNNDISNWKISKKCNTENIFYMGQITNWNKPKYLRK